MGKVHPQRLGVGLRRDLRRAASQADKADTSSLPWIIFLQGGPGFEARSPPPLSRLRALTQLTAAASPLPRPQSPRVVEAGGWVKAACDAGFNVGLVDQRGTGLSSRISTREVLARGSADAQADYLARFRADSIVMDCEAARLPAGISPLPSLAGRSRLLARFGAVALQNALSSSVVSRVCVRRSARCWSRTAGRGASSGSPSGASARARTSGEKGDGLGVVSAPRRPHSCLNVTDCPLSLALGRPAAPARRAAASTRRG